MSGIPLSKINQGDKVVLKKPHACGCNTFEIVKKGADFKLKCLACAHIILLDAIKTQKSIRKILTDSSCSGSGVTPPQNCNITLI